MKKRIFYIILGGILFTTVSVLAYNLSSNEVFYKKVNNEDMTVQEALDDLYTKVTTQSGYTEEQNQASCPSGSICISDSDLGTPQYYAFGTYKGLCTNTDTGCSSYSDFPTTSTTPPEGKNVYAAKYDDDQYGVCIKRNGEEHCFRGRNYIAEAKHLQEVFSDVGGYDPSTGVGCIAGSSYAECDASDFYCLVYSNGNVHCRNHGGGPSCSVNPDGSVECS